MKLKKIVSAALATIMVLALAVPAFASAPSWAEDAAERLKVTSASEFEVEMEGEVYAPVIRVQVTSKNAKVYINPTTGKIAGEIVGVKEGTAEVKVGYEFEGLGVASTPILIRSDSDGPLNVNATVTVTVPKSVTLATAKVGTSVATKQVAVQVAGAALGDSTNLAAMNGEAFSANKTFVAESGKSQAYTDLATIPAALNATSGKVTPQYGAVMLTGSCALAKNVTSNPWSEDDALEATIVLTFSAGAED